MTENKVNKLVLESFRYGDTDVEISIDNINYRGIEKIKDSLLISYSMKKNDFSYRINTETNKAILNSNSENDIIELALLSSRTYRFNEHDFIVFKYSQFPNGVDNEIIHYISLDYGLLIKKSQTWSNFCQINSQNKNQRLLKTIIINDNSFFKNDKIIDIEVAPRPYKLD